MAPLRVPGVFDADDRHLGYGCAGLRDKLADAVKKSFMSALEIVASIPVSPSRTTTLSSEERRTVAG